VNQMYSLGMRSCVNPHEFGVNYQYGYPGTTQNEDRRVITVSCNSPSEGPQPKYSSDAR
jgi:hypothetical protein